MSSSCLQLVADSSHNQLRAARAHGMVSDVTVHHLVPSGDWLKTPVNRSRGPQFQLRYCWPLTLLPFSTDRLTKLQNATKKTPNPVNTCLTRPQAPKIVTSKTFMLFAAGFSPISLYYLFMVITGGMHVFKRSWWIFKFIHLSVSLSFVDQCLILQKQNKNSFSITAIYSFEVNKLSLLISCLYLTLVLFVLYSFLLKKEKEIFSWFYPNYFSR